jgi:hypothetical protein
MNNPYKVFFLNKALRLALIKLIKSQTVRVTGDEENNNKSQKHYRVNVTQSPQMPRSSDAKTFAD